MKNKKMFRHFYVVMQAEKSFLVIFTDISGMQKWIHLRKIYITRNSGITQFRFIHPYSKRILFSRTLN